MSHSDYRPGDYRTPGEQSHYGASLRSILWLLAAVALVLAAAAMA